MKRLVLLVLVSFFATGISAQTVTVAAAANLASLEAPLIAAFAKQNPGLSLKFTFGASGTLVTQITQGAPFQAFLSADLGFAQKLVDAGLAVGPVKTYAVGQLIFLTTQAVDLKKGLNVVLDASVAQLAVANPETAPYGNAAVEALTAAGLWDKVKAKVVTAQNITQAVQFTLTAAGFGFVNRSALFTPEGQPYAQEGKNWFAVDPKLYTPLAQGFVVLKAAADLPAVKAFAAFLASPAALAVFDAFGYGRP